ncbi:hypothetical protein [Kutzneria sp. NPDC052558]|uniref:hypothetical protein n=1 Tax=Kutzneria sp. NPDC052558 TaxID=3364121 RepID=UPI0037CC8318
MAGKMPKVVHKRVSDIQWELPLLTPVKYLDHQGRDAGMILPRNWTVCHQEPAPGTKITGTVTLTVVKHGVKCPVSH